MVAGHRQHRLSHCLRRKLLQCAVHVSPAGSGSALYPDHGRDLSPRSADCFSPAESGTRPNRHPGSASPQESSSASAVATIAHGELGAQYWSPHGPVIRNHLARETSSRDGLSLLSGHHSAGRAVLPTTHRSRCRTSHSSSSLSLSEREIDLEELTRCGAVLFSTIWFCSTRA